MSYNLGYNQQSYNNLQLSKRYIYIIIYISQTDLSIYCGIARMLCFILTHFLHISSFDGLQTARYRVILWTQYCVIYMDCCQRLVSRPPEIFYGYILSTIQALWTQSLSSSTDFLLLFWYLTLLLHYYSHTVTKVN